MSELFTDTEEPEMANLETQAVGLTCHELPADEYHADDAIGASMLEDFYKSRRLYEGRYVTKTVPRKSPTPAMELGTLIHMRLLEPDRYHELLAPPAPELAPDGKKWLRRKDSDHEKWWAEYEQSVAGKISIDEETIKLIEGVTQSVLSRRWASRLLRSDGQREYSIFWTDKETGLNLKIRVDWFSAICLDLKTTADPSPVKYSKTLVGLGYHRKLAHYRAGISEYTGEEAIFIHIAVGTESPFPCGAYEIDDRNYFDVRTPRLGEKQWRQLLRDLAKCYETGDWSDPFEREICELKLPSFAFSESAYHYGG